MRNSWITALISEARCCGSKRAFCIQSANNSTNGLFFQCDKHDLNRFAKLVAAAEREACAKICEDLELPFVADAIHARKNK